ncbi:DUF2500 domain-containing protein [Jeotgalibacillus campisalis]|uniref:DUF2500 domain-containing protein n=1 Tax=Jeotgalibacillus campisalis TaxID=220754 RepID=A0A0C2RRE2_9BACL|nr:DUF2500 domain-containing protein [Jeotgalibacillus campisalis]KIL52835.1 hypothetical protein KR50_01640 [Jeotgalibacillus campisalis]
MNTMLQFSSSPSNFMLTGVPIFIAIVFIIVFGIIIYTSIKGVSVWSSNNRAPRVQEEALVLSKRTENRSVGGNQHPRTTSYYYITFEFINGTRKEFEVKGNEFGLLAEGDKGSLDYQGTRFHKFMRESS